MKVGIFGGSFNPIHISHINLARQFAEALDLERILLVPTFIPPHKQAVDMASAADRMAMCRLAVADDPLFQVSDIEVRRQDTSYTWVTLTELRRELPGDAFYLIMGSDMFLTVTEWKEASRLFALATLCTGAREKGDFQKLVGHGDKLAALGAKSIVLNMAPQPMASTEIRRMIREGGDTGGYLPSAVRDYIDSHKLYRE